MSEWVETNVQLLGKQVRVKIGDEAGAPVVVEGKLLSFGEGGDFVVQDEMGFNHYCWPLLFIEAVQDYQDGEGNIFFGEGNVVRPPGYEFEQDGRRAYPIEEP